jgi:hypothetical protein
MVETQFKIVHVPEAIGLSFEDLDLVVGPLHSGTGDAVVEIVEQSGSVTGERFCYSCKRFDSGVHGVFDPYLKEALFGGMLALFFCQTDKMLVASGLTLDEV